MSANHLLSASLFSELFQHNLVSPDGRIIANEQQLRDYSAFLIRRSKDKVASLHVERKNLVNEVEKLLKLDSRTEGEEKRLKELVEKLGLEFDEEGLLRFKEPRKLKERYLGPKEPQKSIFERRIEAELKSSKILKRDLKKLDDWLEQLAHLRPMKGQEEQRMDDKEARKKFRQRTLNRMNDIENARKKLIKHHYKDYDERVKNNLSRKVPKEKYLPRIALKAKGGNHKDEIKKGKSDGKDITTKEKKNVKDEAVVKSEGAVIKAQADDKTAIKDYAEDVDVTTKAKKSVNDKVATKDNGKNEDVTITAQTSIVEDNSRDATTETKTNVDDEIDNFEVKDAATEATDAATISVTENNDRVSVIDNVDAKDEVAKATDATTEISTKIHESKEQMLNLNEKINNSNKQKEETISKSNTDDKDVATKVENSNVKSEEDQKEASSDPRNAAQNR